MGYRRRAVFHVAPSGKAHRLGFFGRRSHERVVVESCPALIPALSDAPSKLAAALEPVAKEIDTLTLLAESGEVAFAVQLTGALRPKIEEAVKRAIHSISARGAVITPKEGRAVLIGKPALPSLSPLHPHVPLYVRPDGFAQANAEANVALVTSAVYELGATEQDRVLELYSGNGNFTFAIAGTSREVVAVESSAVSTELARRSAQEGGVTNVRFMLGDAIKLSQGLVKEKDRFDLLFVDPPRTGAPGIAEIAKGLGVRRVVYVACDPAALARDAEDLKARGFAPKALQLVDMFPQTHHIEAVMAFDAAQPG
ncbi:MAG: class I SAM-dependent RNA methyltransferase [Myxococcaceae bacterium]